MPAQTLITPTVTADVFGHGTRMCDLVGGSWAGSAKNAQIISVKLNDNGETGDSRVLLTNLLAAFAAVVDDVVKKGRQGKAVINMSISKFI